MNSAERALERKGMLCDPEDHFRGAYEVECKFRIRDREILRARLEKAGARAFMLGNVETDVYLDWRDGRLSNAAQSLVLREMLPSERVLWISKGPGKDKCLSMNMTSFDQALAMHRSIGFEERIRIVKQRDVYFRGPFHWTLDVVDGLGSFAEIAVMTDDASSLAGWRDKVAAEAKTFDLDDASLVENSYLELLRAAS